MSWPKPTSQYHHSPTSVTDPSQEHLSASGKIVLVTGGGTTIGAATVEAFAKAKAKDIFLVGRRVNLLEEVQKKLSVKYPKTKFHALRTDISKESDVRSLFQEINKIGFLDILVANAGYLPTPSTIASSETAEWWAGFEINVLGTYLLAKAFLGQSRQPTGTPVFIGVNTGAAIMGSALGPMSGYVTSKLAAMSMVEFLQTENPNIKAFSVSPGIVQSEMSAKAELKGITPSDSPDLMGHLAVWLASPESDFLKGRFLWANWDIEELVKLKEKIVADPKLLTVTLEGWSNDFAVLK